MDANPNLCVKKEGKLLLQNVKTKDVLRGVEIAEEQTLRLKRVVKLKGDSWS